MSARRIYPQLLADGLGVSLLGSGAEAGGVDAEIVFRERGPSRTNGPVIEPDGLVILHSTHHAELHTELVSVRLDLETNPACVEAWVHEPLAPEYELAVHLTVLLHKILFLMDRLLLHAAAVRLAGRVSLLVGDKGAGKTTSSLAVARAGGAILAEDHVLVRRTPGEFLVSGCDERARLTERTEGHFFPIPVQAPVRELGGLTKKEIRTADHFESVPYRDYAVHRLCLLTIGTEFSAERISRPAAVVGLLGSTRKLQRFAGPRDQDAYLGYLADFVQTLACYRIKLSPDLARLDRLVEFLATPA